MPDRKEAFAEWRKGIITDDYLKQVVNDLQTVNNVLCAMNGTGIIARIFRVELDAAQRMDDSRRRERK